MNFSDFSNPELFLEPVKAVYNPLKIVEYPKVIETPCKPVEPPFEGLIDTVHDMIGWVKEHNGLGLAAPQIGDFRTYFVIDWGSKPTVVINPSYTVMEAPWKKGVESCFSLPGKRYLVKRPTRIHAKWHDLFGQQSCILNGMMATIFHHEVLHLEGKCICDIGKEVRT